jgi:hemin uptake protein HemP
MHGGSDPSARPPGPPHPPKRIRAQELFAGNPVVEIELQGQIYHLRLTRQGKLILTK